ncbi:MAG TPA: peptidase, partial [Nitrosopumilaceae archaeon]
KETVNTGSNPNLLGISLPSGVDTKIVNVQSQGTYLMKIVLIGIGQNDFEKLMIKEFEFEINNSKIPKPVPPTEKTEIPEWIKNNAGWWANDQIDDNSFVQGIQFMIKNKIMNIPTTTQGSGSGMNEIPSWIKSNAGWWASGQIDDNSFIQGIQYLIKEGIIRV